MSNLILIRHGQGGRLGEHYDTLSPLGREQARRLGQYWTEPGVEFDAVFTGTLERQRLTESIVAETYRERGLAWHEPQVLAELDEYDAQGILAGLMPELLECDENIRRLQANYEATPDGPERYANFQRMFEAAMRYWTSGDHRTGDFETYADFSGRVRRGIERISEAHVGGQRVAVFTSGGVIGVAVQSALGAPDHAAIELNWRVRNGSLTEFIFSRARFSLEWFNAFPHLDEPRLQTFR